METATIPSRAENHSVGGGGKIPQSHFSRWWLSRKSGMTPMPGDGQGRTGGGSSLWNPGFPGIFGDPGVAWAGWNWGGLEIPGINQGGISKQRELHGGEMEIGALGFSSWEKSRKRFGGGWNCCLTSAVPVGSGISAQRCPQFHQHPKKVEPVPPTPSKRSPQCHQPLQGRGPMPRGVPSATNPYMRRGSMPRGVPSAANLPKKMSPMPSTPSRESAGTQRCPKCHQPLQGRGPEPRGVPSVTNPPEKMGPVPPTPCKGRFQPTPEFLLSLPPLPRLYPLDLSRILLDTPPPR